MANAHAYLGVSDAHHVFRFNPDQVQWGYKQNSVSTDTVGGRVVQLLSVSVDAITVNGVTGARDELQRLAENVRAIMDYQIRTLQAVHFRVPSRKWDFRVYVTAMPQMGWDVAATTYPYSLQMQIVDDLNGIKVPEIEAAALLHLYNGIGYDPSVHGGDPKAFDKTVKTVLNAAAGLTSGGAKGGSGGGGGGAGANVNLNGGSFGEAALKAALPFNGGTYWFGGFDAPGGALHVTTAAGNPHQGATDCSGLTEYGYQSGAGISIGATANCQLVGARNAGVFFSDRAKLKTGDLMFYNFGGVASCADHVAFWVSNARGGTVFHAHSTSSPIQYSYNYGWDSWIGAARPESDLSGGDCACR